jgi:hypothetical protein
MASLDDGAFHPGVRRDRRWAYPVNSLIGYAILLLGVPPYLHWRRQGTPESVAAT